VSGEASPKGDPRLGQIVVWLLLAAALATGIYFYFRYERRITPLLGRDGNGAPTAAVLIAPPIS
jgi:hypothetical protein